MEKSVNMKGGNVEKDMVSLKVDENLVLPVIQKQIQAAIIENLGSGEEIIGRMVKVALSQKVNQRGVVSKYQSDNKHDYLEVVAGNAIREAATDALREWLDKNKAKIRKAVLTELKSPSRQKTMAKAFADAVEESITNRWLFKANISFRETRE